MRVCAVQMPHGDTLEENLRRARSSLEGAAAGGAGLALLPEYFFAVFPGGSAASGASEDQDARARASGSAASGASDDQDARARASGSAASGASEDRDARARASGSAASGASEGQGARARASGPPAAAPHARTIRAMLADASRTLGLAVAANVIEARGAAFANVGVVYEAGALVMEQDKVHPMPREAAAGVAGGPSLRTARVAGHDAGMLVCADILYPEAARVLSLQGAEILLNPVMSPWREVDDGREARVAMYVGRAYDAGAFVVKAAGYRERAIAGRSLVTAPWGVLARAKGDFAEELLFAKLDFDKLRAFREKQAQFPARRPEAYDGLL